jgi:VCBS repeat-containing protein
MPKDKKVEATSVASPRSRLGKDKAVPKLKAGQAHQDNFLNFLINAFGDNKDVSISIEGNKRIPIKDLKKKIN